MWLDDDDGSSYNNKSFDYYFLAKYQDGNYKLNKTIKDTRSLDEMDISFIENYLRKKKLERINKK